MSNVVYRCPHLNNVGFVAICAGPCNYAQYQADEDAPIKNTCVESCSSKCAKRMGWVMTRSKKYSMDGRPVWLCPACVVADYVILVGDILSSKIS